METFLIYLAGVTLAVFLLYFLGVALAPYRPDSVKNDHFECGLPASSSVPKKANFGFFVYAIMFIVADMTGLFFTLFVYGQSRYASLMASFFALIMAVAITIAMKEHRYAENS
ncbi:NADH-quinone oxidoreductase subunit A [Sulfurovum sp.]|uniref:NADH-quinone oxidoreductase subunit A n=1 Tax=Sulfurovum sp. TaxID=1969726 RepID=UPI0025FAB3B7|nr:NADH-quinone oxidoreductase subunit A [Sulfurovum sp.]